MGLMGWDVLSGVVEEYFDQRLLDLGRHRHWRALGKATDDYVMLTEEPSTRRNAFLVTRSPWRLALFDLADEESAGLVAWLEDGWISLQGDPSAPRMDGDATGPDVTNGDPLKALLAPSWLTLVIGGPLTASMEIPPERLFAALGQEGTEQSGACLSLGAERYRVRYNEELGIITNWHTYIDGTEAQRTLLSNLCSMNQ